MKYKALIINLMVLCLFTIGFSNADTVTITLYVDGEYVGQGTSDNALSFPFDRLTIGAEGNRWFPYNGFEGLIDEFAVYAGSDPCIAAHYSADPCNYANVVLVDNPLLYLRFEDSSSDNNDIAVNSGSADTNGVYIGAISLVSGYVGNAAELHGASEGTGDCIDVSDTSGALSLTDITVEMWVKTTQSTDYPRLFQHNGDDQVQDSYGAMFVPDTNAIGLIGGGTTHYLTKEIADGTWHHIVITYDSLQPDVYEAEVRADNPVLYLKFDNSMEMDFSDNHNYVLYNPAAAVKDVAGAVGKAIYLDGTGGPEGDNCAVVATNDPYRTPAYGDLDDSFAFAPNDITFEFWMKTLPPGEPQMHQYAMFFQQIKADETKAPGMGNSDGTLRVLNGTDEGWWYPGVDTPNDGEWHHIVVTYDEDYGGDPCSMGIQLYLDGTLVGSTVASDANGARLGPEMDHILIGGENDRGYIWNTYAGYIDEFAIYEGILPADRVAAHYAAWETRNCEEVWARNAGLISDIDKDCDVDFEDYAAFALMWMQCNDPADGNCTPNW